MCILFDFARIHKNTKVFTCDETETYSIHCNRVLTAYFFIVFIGIEF